MLITCPFCGAAAKLKENQPIPGVYSAPRYRLTCSNCAETVVGTPDTHRRHLITAANR